MKAFTYAAGGLIALAVTLYPLSLAIDLTPIVYLAGVTLVAFALALVSNEWVLAGPGAAMLIAEYAIALESANVAVDRFAPVLALGALIVLETIDLVTVVTRRPAPHRDVVVAHAQHALVATVVGAAVAGAVMLAAQTAGGGPGALVALAAVCGLMAIVIAVSLAHRAVEGES